MNRILAIERLFQTRLQLDRCERGAARLVHQTDLAVGRGDGDSRRRKSFFLSVWIGDDDRAATKTRDLESTTNE